MTRVAFVTDSASDLDPRAADAAGIRIVPLVVDFGGEILRANVDLTAEAFWARMASSSGVFPKTAATGPAEFAAAYEAAFADGAEAVISIHVAETLSSAIKSARLACDAMPGREIHVIDSGGASMVQAHLAYLGLELAAAGTPAAAIAATLRDRVPDTKVFVALETLEYLRRGGRISGAQAAVGTLLSIKPIITIEDGRVEAIERIRTRGRARERVIELACARPIERLAVLHTVSEDVDGFRESLVARAPGGIDGDKVTTSLVGPSVGPHLGPGCVGAAILYRA